MTPTQAIPIARIRLDGGTQPRAALDFEAIEDYSEAMSAGAKFPPVTVFFDGTDYWLADGFHRVKAAYAAGYDTIECEVRQGTVKEAQWYSFSANRTNGLRRTNQDKQRAVKAALLHPNSSGISDRAIGRHVGVSHNMVAEWRLHLSSDDRCESRTVTRRGTTYRQNTARIGKRKRQPKQRPAQRKDTSIPENDNGSEQFDSVFRAIQILGDCGAAPEDVARRLIARPDRDQIISSMEKADDFLKLCASEARGAGIAAASGEQPCAAARADECHPGTRAGVAEEERPEQPPAE